MTSRRGLERLTAAMLVTTAALRPGASAAKDAAPAGGGSVWAAEVPTFSRGGDGTRGLRRVSRNGCTERDVGFGEAPERLSEAACHAPALFAALFAELDAFAASGALMPEDRAHRELALLWRGPRRPGVEDDDTHGSEAVIIGKDGVRRVPRDEARAARLRQILANDKRRRARRSSDRRRSRSRAPRRSRSLDASAQGSRPAPSLRPLLGARTSINALSRSGPRSAPARSAP